MSSKEAGIKLNLERDIPTTPEDVAAVRVPRAVPVARAFEEVQRLVDALPPEARVQSRKTAEGRPDFELP